MPPLSGGLFLVEQDHADLGIEHRTSQGIMQYWHFCAVLQASGNAMSTSPCNKARQGCPGNQKDERSNLGRSYLVRLPLTAVMMSPKTSLHFNALSIDQAGFQSLVIHASPQDWACHMLYVTVVPISHASTGSLEGQPLETRHIQDAGSPAVLIPASA